MEKSRQDLDTLSCPQPLLAKCFSGAFGVAIYESRCFQECLVTLVQVLPQSQLTEEYVSELDKLRSDLQTGDRWSGFPHIPTGDVLPRVSCATARELYCTQKKLTFLLVYGN